MSAIRSLSAATAASLPSSVASGPVATNIERVRRAVCHHQWATLKEWVGALDELADLSDDAIDELARR